MSVNFALGPAVLVLAGVFFFAVYYLSILRPRKGTLDWVALQEPRPFTFAVKRHKMDRKDTLPVLLITAAYALTAFFSLGSLTAPDYRQGPEFASVRSCLSNTDIDPSYTLELEGEAVQVDRLWHYCLGGTGAYNLEVSADGKRWSTLWTRVEPDQWGRDQTVYYWADAQGWDPSYALPQTNNHVFKWTETTPTNPEAVRVKYLRLTARVDRGPLQLGKLLLLGEDGKPIQAQWRMADGSDLPADLAYALTVDDTVPQTISWRNSGYFDEIYHPRTALEHIQGQYPFENSHPPLGKLILSLGILMFGMTPFGWRFMGVLLGVLMVPLFYLFLKNIFGKRNIAVCGTILLATEFMHLTQTRIATIDTYGVFFILLSYLFFYRWLTASATPNKKGKTSQGYGQLALSGIFWGVGCACKWTVIYAGAGLAVLYLIHLVLRIRSWDKDEQGRRAGLGKWLAATLGVSVLCFVAVPVYIYTLSYIPYALASGKSLWEEMWRNQIDMFTYHNQVHSYHPYASRWYQWLVDGRPILYYYKDLGGGMVEKFAAFTNPLTTWLGAFAMVTCLGRCLRRVWAKLTLVWGVGFGCCLVCWLVGHVENGDFDPALSVPARLTRLLLMALCLAVYLLLSTAVVLLLDKRPSALAVFVSVGFAAQFLPWVCIGRVTFAYHYFPATLFLILAICMLFHDLMECPRARWRLPVYGVTAASVVLYAMFYPYLVGLAMPTWYFTNFLRFLPSWP